MTTLYALYDDGSAATVTADDSIEPVLSKPGRFVSATEYRAAVDALTAAKEEYVSRMRLADYRRIRDDWSALVAVGVPDDTARRITRFSAEAEASLAEMEGAAR